MKFAFIKRKYLLGGIAAIILLVFILGSYNLLWNNRNSFEKHDKDLTWYGIDVSFNPQDGRLDCKQRVYYINTEKDSIINIYFHIYPNSFKYEEKAVFPPEEMSRAYPDGFSPGFLEFSNLKLNGKPASYTTQGYSDDILMISLEQALEPGDRADIWMEYTVKLPRSPGRFGYWDNTYNLGNWYPILCVYDERGWNLEPYYTLGDPFYSDISNYKVSISAPKDFIIASTGELMAIDEGKDQNIWHFEAVTVRDFAWVASQKFKTSSMTIGDTTIYSYYYTQEAGEKALDYGASALRIFNELFGAYPYGTLSIVQSDFFIGGMEYPQLVMIDGSLYETEQDYWLEVVVVHEVAHQWWYGLVGNDQIYDSWLDEALTEYSTILYYGQRYGQEEEHSKYQELIDKGRYQLFKVYRDSEDMDETIQRPLYEFEDWIEYDALVYGKGAIMFHEVRQEMGDENFIKVLKTYFENNKFQNAKPEDLFKACETVTGQNWESFFNQWLHDRN
ncbi:MAG: M1 family metallopeptidase [Clostridiales bacterium]|nr:M1 family metallopeptidase [Clostridiales bacterium]